MTPRMKCISTRNLCRPVFERSNVFHCDIAVCLIYVLRGQYQQPDTEQEKEKAAAEEKDAGLLVVDDAPATRGQLKNDLRRIALTFRCV